jgi:hypothetical protein
VIYFIKEIHTACHMRAEEINSSVGDREESQKYSHFELEHDIKVH